MTKRIHIENLRIKLPRGMRRDAHSIASSIGNDIARNVAIAASGRSGNLQVSEISVGRVQDISAVGQKAGIKVRQVLSRRGRK
jgi:hypothetical protein